MLSSETQNWNRMLELWAEGKLLSPYNELIHYENEINSGGHWKYIDDLTESGDLKSVTKELIKILPRTHKRNLKRALRAYPKTLKNNEKAEEVIEKCDNYFYEKEQEKEAILIEYSNQIRN